MVKKITDDKWIHKLKKGFTKKRFRIMLIVSVILLILLFSTNLILYLHYLLGNDILVTLESDDEEFILENGGKKEISFHASTITNPFCSAYCNSSFVSVTDGKLIDNAQFSLCSGNPMDAVYEVTAPDYGTGLVLYRFLMECWSDKGFFCKTGDLPAKEEMLIFMRHNLTPDQKILKDSVILDLENTAEEILMVQKKYLVISGLLDDISPFISTEDFELRYEKILLRMPFLESGKEILYSYWHNESYAILQDELPAIDKMAYEIDEALDMIGSDALDRSDVYDSSLGMLETIDQRLLDTTDIYTLDKGLQAEIYSIIIARNKIADAFDSPIIDIYKTSQELAVLDEKISATIQKLDQINFENAVKLGIKNMIFDDILFNMTGESIIETGIFPYYFVEEENLSLKNACIDSKKLNEMYSEILEDHICTTGNLTNDTSILFRNMRIFRQGLISNYIDALPDTSDFDLLRYEIRSLQKDLPSNVSSALICWEDQIGQYLPDICNESGLVYPAFPSIDSSWIDPEDVLITKEQVMIPDPSPGCDVSGERLDCCDETDCLSISPLLFLHGHSVSKSISAKASLSAFDSIIGGLEKQGILNLGSMTLYSPDEISEGIWGMPPLYLAIKGSYYYDIFQESGSDILFVQAKSENLDTYAIRLDELIEDIKFKTKREKVIIIAHSMGGLVARRYLQIFGIDDVEKMILIGTPNHGVTGSISSLCPVTGGRYECRDMDEDSLFINKLNNDQLPDIPIHSIVGIGCDTEGKDGDGVVQKESAILEGATNYLINGSCALPDTLHGDLIDIEKYPEVLSIVESVIFG